MKKIIAALVIFLTVSGAVFAKKNTISGGFGGLLNTPLLVGTEVFGFYEREIIPPLSVSIRIAEQYYPIAGIAIALSHHRIDDFYSFVIDAQARWYPYADVFHVDAGMGWGIFLMSMPCLVVTPGVGWKIKFGSSPVSLNIDIRSEIFIPLEDNIFKYKDADDKWVEFRTFTIGPRVGVGFSF